MLVVKYLKWQNKKFQRKMNEIHHLKKLVRSLKSCCVNLEEQLNQKEKEREITAEAANTKKMKVCEEFKLELMVSFFICVEREET